MSVRFRLVHMFESSVRSLFATVCQKKSTRRGLPDEARAEDDVGVAVEDRLDEPRVLGRVVLEVGVLDERDVAGHVRGPPCAPPRPCPGSPRGRRSTQPVLRPCRAWRARNSAEHVARAVGRAVVDDDDLLRDRHRQHALEERAHGPRLVVDGDEDREAAAGSHAAAAFSQARRGRLKRANIARGRSAHYKARREPGRPAMAPARLPAPPGLLGAPRYRAPAGERLREPRRHPLGGAAGGILAPGAAYLRSARGPAASRPHGRCGRVRVGRTADGQDGDARGAGSIARRRGGERGAAGGHGGSVRRRRAGSAGAGVAAPSEPPPGRGATRAPARRARAPGVSLSHGRRLHTGGGAPGLPAAPGVRVPARSERGPVERGERTVDAAHRRPRLREPRLRPIRARRRRRPRGLVHAGRAGRSRGVVSGAARDGRGTAAF